MKVQAKKSFLIDILFIIAVMLLFFVAGKFLLSYLLPFVIAAFVAWSVQKPAGFISQKVKIKTGISAAVLAALLYLFAATAVFFIIYRIALALGNIFNDLPSILDSVVTLISKAEKRITSALNEISPDFTEQISLFAADMLNNIRIKITGVFSSSAATIAKKAPSFLFSSVIALVASCYIAKDFKGLTKFLSYLCGKKIYINLLKIKDILCSSVLKIIKGYLLLMLLTFGELTVGFLIIGIKYAPLWALLIALIDLLPVLGTGVVLIPWAIAEFFIGNTRIGISLFVIYITITIVRNFSEPKIIGNKIGINPLFTLLAMFIGLKLFGFAGLFILPVTLIVIIKYYKNEMDEEKNINRVQKNFCESKLIQ